MEHRAGGDLKSLNCFCSHAKYFFQAGPALHNGPWLCQRHFCEQQQDRAIQVCSTAGEGCSQIWLLLSRVCLAT